ncbi:immunoglobulin-like domain-containing protein, partial [Enterococcus villorum]
ETLNGTIGDSYETQAKEIDGYVLKETPENAKGIFSDKAQTVTYVYEADVDHKLTANKFTIGKDTYVTGTAGADIGYVDLYINGVFAKRAQVNADGSYKVYGTGIQNKADDVKVVALDADKKPIEPEVSSPVELEILGEENEFKLQTNDYTFGDVYVTGTYDNDKADRVKLLIDGKVVKQNIIGASDSDQFSLNVAGYITGIDDHLYEIAEYNGNNIIRRTTINVKEKEEVNYTITANDYTVGEQAITGSWNGDKNSTHVALKVDGQIVKLAEVNSDGTYSLSANGFVTSPDQDVEVVLYNKATKQIFSSITPKITMGVTAEVFTIGEDNNIIGTFDSRETTDVDTIRLLEDGVAVKLVKYSALAEADQSPTTAYTLAAKAVITDKTKTYKIQHLKDGKLHSSTTLSVK